MAKAKEANQRPALAVTSGARMRATREEGVVLPFPSGNNYRIRIPGAAGLLKRGNLPNVLLSFAVDAFYTSVTEEKYDAFTAPGNQASHALETMESLRVVCEEMLLDPRVTDKPQTDNEVRIEDIPLMDQLWAFRLCFMEAQALYPFRDEQAVDVGHVAAREDVSARAE